MIGTIARKALALCFFVWVASSQQPAPPAGYVFKPLRPHGWTPPMRPFTRLADVKAQHRGEKEWSEWVVKDEHLWSQYIQSAPGSKVSPRFHPDTREWWVIVEGLLDEPDAAWWDDEGTAAEEDRDDILRAAEEVLGVTDG